MPMPFAIPVLLLAASASAPAAARDAAWELIDAEDGVRLFRHRERPARLLALATAEARIEDVAEVLRDTAAFPGWLDRCREASRVETVDDAHMTLHLVMGLPAGLQRDVVVKVDVRHDLDRARGVVDLTGVPGSPVPIPPGARRMRAFDGGFVLEVLGRERTGIAYTLEADADVSLPSFLVARTTRSMARNTVRRLAEVASSGRYAEAGRRSRDRAIFEALLADEGRVRAALRARLSEHFRDPAAIERLVGDGAVVHLLAHGDGRLAEALFLAGDRDARAAVARAVLRVHAASAPRDAAAPPDADAALLAALVDGG